MADNPTFQIPKEVIEPIIQAHVTTAVMNALGGHQKLVSDAVASVLTQSVDSDGKPSSSSYYGKPFIEHVMTKCIRDAVLQAVQEEMPKHKDVIRAHISSQLRQKNSPLLKQFVDGMAGALADPDNLKYAINVSYETAEQRRNRR
jgi:hypothetical protein